MEDSDVYEITLNLDVYLKIHNENILKKRSKIKYKFGVDITAKNQHVK